MVTRSSKNGIVGSRPKVQTTYLLKQLELAVRQAIDRVVRPFGLTTPQFTALSVLVRHPKLSSADLARQAFVSPQAAHEMVAALERKGLVTRVADPSHQRTLEIHLTPLGRRTLVDCTPAVIEIEDRLLADLDRVEQTTFRDLLLRCRMALVTSESAV